MPDNQTSLPRLRTTAPADMDGLGGAASDGATESIDLVVDLIGATRLLPEDKLARAAGRARQTGSFARALVEEGIASSQAVARHHAAQFRLPLVDFGTTDIEERA